MHIAPQKRETVYKIDAFRNPFLCLKKKKPRVVEVKNCIGSQSRRRKLINKSGDLLRKPRRDTLNT